MNFRPSIPSAEIGALPLFRYEGPIHLVHTAEELELAIQAVLAERVVGFDTETRAAFQRGESYPPALLQLATSSAVYLVRLQQLPSPDWFPRLFSEPGVTKAGVSLAYDLKKLRELAPFEDRSFVELADYADHAGVESNGLRGLAAALLGVRVSKNAQRSNWSRHSLSHAQCVYAATDAWICRELYLKLELAIGAPPPPGKRPCPVVAGKEG